MKILRQILVIFLLTFCTVCYADNLTITVISDAHISADKKNNTMTKSISRLIKAVEQANHGTSDIVVFLGDNVQSADRINTAMFAKIINKLKKPYYVTIGNRDVAKSKDLPKEEVLKITNKFSSNKISKLPSYKKKNDLIFVFLSGANETFPTYKGYYKNYELDFLDKTLTKFKDKKVIIFQHFPVVPPCEDSIRETVKPENYLAVLNKHNNVLAVVSGHYHKEDVVEQNSVKHISIGPLFQTGEYEQIKIFKNKDGSYSMTARVLYAN